MKLFRLLVTASAIAVAAQAADRRITLLDPYVIAGTKLNPGEYKVQVNGDKVKIYSPKQSVEATAKVETGEEKYSTNSLKYEQGDLPHRITEIRLGGTNTKIVFSN
jgi:hypothetical protein